MQRATEAKPALLISMEMLGSSFSSVTTFARSVSLLRSATNRNDVASCGTGKTCRQRLECHLAVCHKYEIVSSFCETIRMDSSDAPRGAGDEGCALRG
jgi:hypothetical protein